MSNGSFLTNSYNILPIDPRMNCGQINGHYAQNHYYPFWNPGVINNEERHGYLTLNLNILKDVFTPNDFWDYNVNHIVPVIRITEGATLKICQGTNNTPRTFTMRRYTGYNKGGQIEIDADSKLIFETSTSFDNRAQLIMNDYCLATVQPQGTIVMFGNSKISINNNASALVKTNGNLFMGQNTNIDINSGGTLTLENNSIYRGSNSSLITVKNNGLFCNKGANANNLTVKYEDGNHYLSCDNIIPEYFMKDSSKIILTNGATLVVPDNCSLYFQGNESLLQMDSNSTIKFGENSKIVFQHGARLNSYKAKFTSLNNNSVWSGIFLNDLSNDTIKNCIIENATNGITIKDKINESSETTASTEITNCSFINSTNNTVLLNAIYATNSSDILIKGNNIYSNQQSNAFNIGIWLEYCSPKNISIIENTINNSLNGINSIQSTPYIARNTITGQTGSVYGIFLDITNGTLEYNNINNFNYSIDAVYSSPNILNNNFSNALTANLNLRKNSTPILTSVISGSTSYLYGGMNTLTGSPSSSAILFSDESYPVLDNGYNKINVNNCDYLQGELPAVLNYTLYATTNYWNGDGLNSSYFNVSSGVVEYEPTFGGINYPEMDGYILNPLGFEISDTIYYKNLGDFTSSDLFIQAILKENQGLYEQAIQKYKEIISIYKESEYAVLSLTKIFDCLQKMNAPKSKYSVHNTYLNTIKNNNEYPLIIREIAEDFIIKGKAKLGNVTEAINDYQNIYNQNQLNSKGFHALINKICLQQSISDSLGDAPSMKFKDNTEHKISLLNLLNLRNQNNIPNNNITNNLVKEFKLSQNYPNPFNPRTVISFQLPIAGLVSLKVYDVLGREIKTLVNEFKQAGNHKIDFNGSEFASGVYYYRLEAKGFAETKRMILIK